MYTYMAIEQVLWGGGEAYYAYMRMCKYGHGHGAKVKFTSRDRAGYPAHTTIH